MKNQQLLKNKKIIVLLGCVILTFIFNVIFFLSFSGQIRTTNDLNKDVNVTVLAESFSFRCKDDLGWRNCYGKQFAELAKVQDLPKTLQALQEVHKVDTKTQDCHIMAHNIMQEAVARDPENINYYLQVVDPIACSYGFLHGIVEARSRFDKDFILNEKTIPQFCQAMVEAKKARGVDETCSHVMGHVVLVTTEWDIEEAVAICYGIPEKLQRECFSGLFMENFTRDNLVAHGLAQYVPWDQTLITQQENLCNSYNGNAGLGCWQEISNIYLQYYPTQPEMVYQLCNRAKTIEYTNQCYQDAVGAYLQLPETNDALYISLCRRYESNPAEFDKCMQYIVRSAVYASLGFTDRAFEYCHVIADRFKSRCFGVLGQSLQDRNMGDRINELCQKAEDYKNFCISGEIS